MEQAHTTQLQGRKASQRETLVDALRGFAVCAILLMNVELFTLPLTDISGGISPELSGLDWLADAAIYVLLHGKGWAMFTLLFGVSFAIMGHDAKRWLRRSLALVGIGVLHTTFVWSGDILLTYSMAALLLAVLRIEHPERQALAGVALVLVPLLCVTAMAVVMVKTGTVPGEASTMAVAIERQAQLAAFSGGSYADATAIRWHGVDQALRSSGWWLFVAVAAGMALIGSAMYRSGVLTAQPGSERLRRWILVGAGSVGAVLTVASLAVDANPLLVGKAVGGRAYLAIALHTLAAPFLGAAIFALVVTLTQVAAHFRAALSVFEPLGKLALTAYLTQSLLGTWIFYGYGLGAWGQLGRADQVLLCVAILAAQLAAAHWYVLRFEYGPAEWLWRWSTNGKRPPFCKTTAVTVAVTTPDKGHAPAMP